MVKPPWLPALGGSCGCVYSFLLACLFGSQIKWQCISSSLSERLRSNVSSAKFISASIVSLKFWHIQGINISDICFADSACSLVLPIALKFFRWADKNSVLMIRCSWPGISIYIFITLIYRCYPTIKSHQYRIFRPFQILMPMYEATSWLLYCYMFLPMAGKTA